MINLQGLNLNKPVTTTHNNIKGFGYSFQQKPDTFVRANLTTCPIGFTGKSNRLKEYKNLTDDLNQTANDAQNALNKQLATEGWSGKTADAISILWNSKNRATLVQSDIDLYKEQVTNLEKSIKTDSFNETFKQAFEVDYNHSNIVRYNKKAKQFETALTADLIAKFTDKNLSENIRIYNKLSGNLKDFNEFKTSPYAVSGSVPYYNHLTTKDEIFKNMEDGLVNTLGDKKILDSILTSSGLNENSSKEDKYKIYGYLSSVIAQTCKISAEKNLKGQNLAQIKEDCDKAYQKAFGTKNDIIARVDKYNASQKAGSACVKFVTNVVLNTLGPGSVLGSCIYSMGKSVALDIADAKTKDVNRDVDLKSLLVNAGLNGISGTINRIIVNKYAGSVASNILAGKTSSNNVASTLTDFVVKEIISKEGVKLPAYAVEEITSAVVNKMAGLNKTENNSALSQKELNNSMAVISEAMTYLTIAKNSNKLNNLTQKEMTSLLNEHITTSMKDNKEFNTWLSKNKTAYQNLLNQLVKNELPKVSK